jgi:hypothetical protein
VIQLAGGAISEDDYAVFLKGNTTPA